MRIFDDLRSGLTPAVEELHQTWDEGRHQPLRGRELAAEPVAAPAFVATAAALVAFRPDQRDFDAALAGTLLAPYALLLRVGFPIAHGFRAPIQLALVPMLFLVPLGAVPLLVAGAVLVSGLPEYLRGDRHPTRAIAAVGDAWYAIGPVLVIGAAGVTEPHL